MDGSKEKMEPHPAHSFTWRFNETTYTSVTCDKARTVEDSLKRCKQFRTIAEKNKNKELVIFMGKNVISSHFPCSLIKNAPLTVKYIKTDKSKQLGRGSDHLGRKGSSGELVMFHVLTEGGKNVKRILKNPELKRVTDSSQFLAVYAYKGEKVKRALIRDGRFQKTIFRRNCALLDTNAEVKTEMSNLVDDTEGKTYKIILLDKSDLPLSQSSLEDYVSPDEPQRSDTDNQSSSLQSMTTELVNDPTPNAPRSNGTQSSERMCDRIHSQFNDLMKRRKSAPKLSRIQNLMRVEFGKHTATCTEVKTMKKLMKHGDSVCQVRINESPIGTGFLLFDKFVLTNAHVLENVYNERRGLDEKVTVHFFYESQESGTEVEVKEVVGYEYGDDESGHMHDWALLRLSDEQSLPDILLQYFGFLPQNVGVCIIGHPEGRVKYIDPCLIVLPEDRYQAVQNYWENQKHITVISRKFFENVAESVEGNRQIVTYNSSLYYGASGSPVFDKNCRVVAMHSGGYTYPSNKRETHSVIEFGYPLFLIIEYMLVHLVERQRFDVLQAYLACSYQHQENIMNSLKKVVESRNLQAFKNALDSQEVKNDQLLKEFFELLSLKEEPSPMDIN